ncbi:MULTISPECIES: flagellar export protein FliJ [Shewanella]|uniref:Flagellar FliJ protein n=1 Tax=Shewanella japonica TaxID=93973 RepID=A0ABN4YKW4_9GAMM|nr:MULTISPECIES: flagellar export protein FliJ [Shewanella]ARD23212.1 Flagellar export protein FliJ [Shewanella japonica]KPZ69904.1 flagellar biosynthesis chaperone [Shewanella sp. P1-14-1]MBQ4891163.1 flagellar export protein FliJ [Shewanella sp. MMG014]OBT10334.1 flagellar export protein FliJ [Shewanella sp. UCD-FRSSP16_17]
MRRTDPLLTVLKLNKEAEEQAALQLKSAQLEQQKHQSQLDALNNYRLEYMKQMGENQGKTLSASQYHSFHEFIKQVDQALLQQVNAVKEAEKQTGYRQVHWQEKQQKRKAVELLLEKNAQKAQQLANKKEQKASDEFAMQQFIRKKSR